MLENPWAAEAQRSLQPPDDGADGDELSAPTKNPFPFSAF